MQKIIPFLWFDGRVQEAVDFYTSVFPNAMVEHVSPGPDGSAFMANFQLAGQKFMALNGGPMFQFTEAVSFYIQCDDQQEVDYFWEKLSEGGAKSRCGWLKDKFGLSWQVIPTALGQLMQSGTTAQRERVMGALMKMDKMDIALLQKAYDTA